MKPKLLLFFVVFTFSGFSAIAQPTIFDELYHPDQVIEATLQFDCKKLIRRKGAREKMPAIMTYRLPDGNMITRELKVHSRGHSRLEVCSFPPLKLDFSKEELNASGFLDAIDELKLVTHCADGERDARIVLKEFTAYKLYNIISDRSLRVQLLRVKYLDEAGNVYAENMGFLIEPIEALALRLEARESEKHVENFAELEPETYNNLLLFQYMIGNVDWDITSLHNIKLIKPLQGAARIPVPYDFDFSGLVMAYYAKPQERVRQTYVGERVLPEAFTGEAAFQQAVQHFLSKEKDILDACANLTQISEQERQEMQDYLTGFFNTLKTPSLTSRKL